jgi:hypothetical protein
VTNYRKTTAGLLGATLLVGAVHVLTAAGVGESADPYLCYDAKRVKAGSRFRPSSRALVSAFGESRFRVRGLLGFCNPARAGAETASADPDAYLAAYAISGRRLKRRNHVVFDRFGPHALTVLRPVSLLVPSMRGPLGSLADPGTPADDTAGDFTCYAVRPQKGSPRFASPAPPLVTDDLGATTYRLKRITKLCAPASAPGKVPSAAALPGHLLCYRARPTGRRPRVAGARAAVHNADFGLAVLSTRGPRELCLPAGKDAPLATPACEQACGDGVLDASCGESCECVQALDTSCAGALIAEPAGSPECRRCLGCRTDDVLCPTTPTTTIGGSTTTTTLGTSPALVRSLGENHDAVDSTMTALTVPASGVTAGDSIIVTFAMDPTDGAVSCSDSRDNVYSVDVDTNVGLDRRGVRAIVCAAHGVNGLTPGDQIVVHHPLTRSKALSANEFRNVHAFDQAAEGWDNNKFPFSGLTSTTTAKDELLVSAIGVEAPDSLVLTQGSNIIPLPASRNPSSGGMKHVSMFPGYRLVDAMGSYATSATLSSGNRWTAAIATYK